MSVPLSSSGRWDADGPEWPSLVAELLPALARHQPDWAVLKNHARLPVVSGDIDLCVPRDRWTGFLEAYQELLGSRGRFAVVTCDHHRGALFTFAVPLGVEHVERSLQIDLIDGIYWKGTMLLSGRDTLAGSTADARGFHRIRSGTEAACLLTASAILPSGALDEGTVQRKDIQTKAREDPEAFVAAMRALHGRPGAVAAARFLAGDWASWIGLVLAGRRGLRGVRQHTLGVRAATFLQRKLQRHWRGFPRQVAGRPEVWLERVTRRHPYSIVGCPPK